MEHSNHSATPNLKIDEALKILSQAAREKKDDLQKTITEKYSHMKEIFSEVTEENREAFNKWKESADAAVQQGKKQVVQAAVSVDKDVHTRPWAYIGGAAAIGLLAGFILAKSK